VTRAGRTSTQSLGRECYSESEALSEPGWIDLASPRQHMVPAWLVVIVCQTVRCFTQVCEVVVICSKDSLTVALARAEWLFSHVIGKHTVIAHVQQQAH
jgi:hypothetical protein